MGMNVAKDSGTVVKTPWNVELHLNIYIYIYIYIYMENLTICLAD
jgi:hypothetical protein